MRLSYFMTLAHVMQRALRTTLYTVHHTMNVLSSSRQTTVWILELHAVDMFYPKHSMDLSKEKWKIFILSVCWGND